MLYGSIFTSLVMIKAILFDFGGVFLDLNRKETMNIPVALSMLLGIPGQKAVELWRSEREAVIIGKETPKEFLNRCMKTVDSTEPLDALFSKWEEMSSKGEEDIDWELLDYVRELKKKVKVYVLSDTIDLAQDYPLSKQVYAEFDGCFLSYREGLVKPNKEAFQNVLDKIGFKPDECVFVDDTERHVEAAKALGINSILYSFKGVALLQNELEKLGVVC